MCRAFLFLGRSVCWKVNGKDRSFSRLAAGCYGPSMIGYHFVADSQPDPRACKLIFAV